MFSQRAMQELRGLKDQESWVREVAYQITMPKHISPPVNNRHQTLEKLNHEQLRALARYFNLRCNGSVATLIGKSSESLRAIINTGIATVRRGEATLMLPRRMEDFITPDAMATKVGKADNESFMNLINAEALKMMNHWRVEIGTYKSNPPEGCDLIIYGTKGRHTNIFLSAELEEYFRELVPPKAPPAPEGVKLYTPTQVCEILRNGHGSKAEDIDEVRKIMEELMDANFPLALDQSGKPAREHIFRHSYSAASLETFYGTDTLVEYMLYNHYSPRTKLHNGDRFITNNNISAMCGVEKKADNFAIIQILLGEAREERKHEALACVIDGEEKEVKLGDVVRKLSAKRINPSFFIHEDVLRTTMQSEKPIINGHMIKQRRTELKEAGLNAMETGYPSQNKR